MFATVECPSCSSKNQRKMNAEVALHFTGLQGLDKPIVWAFPEVSICLNCGFAVFKLPNAPLKELRHSTDTDNLVRAG
jgi:uncharacterized protein (DUF2225 family)